MQINVMCPGKSNLNQTCMLLHTKLSVKSQVRYPGVLTGSSLKSLALCATTAKNANKMLVITKNVFEIKTERVILLLLHRILMHSLIE